MSVKTYKPNGEVLPGTAVPESVQRVALGVEYLGAQYQGFQKQASTSNTIQAHLEQALSRIAAAPITLVCAGRTDAGVSATGQVVHFDTCAQRPIKAWLMGTNTHLPDDIRVVWAKLMPLEFHARFSATSRSYRYQLHSAPVRSAIYSQQMTWTSHQLDVSLMAAAAQYLLGEQDFSAFRAAQCQAQSPVRCVEAVSLERTGDLILFDIRANAFLHHMVRNIVGSLIEVGRGARPAQWIAQLLAERDRRKAAATAPPWGLSLVTVGYPHKFAIPDTRERQLYLSPNH